MEASEPDELVRTFISLLEDKDLDRACALVSEECEYDNVPIGKVVGPDGIREILSGFFGACEKLEWTIERQVCDGTSQHATVFNERNDRFLIHGRWASLPVTGLFEIRHGKIVLWRDYFDRQTLFAAMSAEQ